MDEKLVEDLDGRWSWSQQSVLDLIQFIVSGRKNYPRGILQSHKRNYRKRAGDFVVVEGMLHYKNKDGSTRLVLASVAEQERVFEECHNDPSGGHMGRTKTVEKIKSRYYWPNQYVDIAKKIKACDRCQRLQPVLKSHSSELHPIPVSPQVWSLVGMDLIGPFKKTASGNQYIITMTCYFSKWVEAFPIQDKSAVSVAKAIYTAYCRHGAPIDIITDQGREFVNKICDALHSSFHVKQRITAAYHPQSNGLDERTNQTMKRCLAKLLNDHADNWDNFIDPVLFGIRTSIQESSKFTPFYLMYGREARFPLEAEMSTSISDINQLGDVQETIDRLSSLQENIFPVVKSNIDNSQSKQKEQYCRRKGILKMHINVDDTVLRLNMVKRTKQGHKMEDTWLGPYKVLQVTSHGCCILQCIKSGLTMKRKVNVSQLKLYCEQPVNTKMTNEDDLSKIGDKPSKRGMGDQPSKSEIGDQPSKSEIGDQPSKSEMGDQPSKSEMGDQPSKSEIGDQPSKSEIGDQPSKSEMGDQPSKSEMGDQPSKSEMGDQPSKSEIGDQPSKSGGSVIEGEVTNNPQILEKQLFDDSLMRLCRTGATFECWTSQEDDFTNLSHCLLEGEHGLSIDPDVSLWLNYRTFHNYSELRIIDDFVIVTDEHHCHFDQFKKEKGDDSHVSFIPFVELIPFWFLSMKKPFVIVEKYGKSYIPFEGSQLDDLCSWISQTRINFMSHGQDIFTRSNASSVISNCSVTSNSFHDDLHHKRDSIPPQTGDIEDQKCSQTLDLSSSDMSIIKSGFLSDKHMHAAQKLLREQFPCINGLQSTLLCQTSGFVPVNAPAIQIHYTGHAHWVTSAYIGSEVHLYDSLATNMLPSFLKKQLMKIYKVAVINNILIVSQMAVQQQVNRVDCGIFSIAFALRAALGHDVTGLHFKQPGHATTSDEVLEKEYAFTLSNQTGKAIYDLYLH